MFSNFKSKQSKYKNNPIEIEGIKFDSKKEYKRYSELKLLEKAKAIKDLKLQQTFELQPTFRKNGICIRSIKYIADFFYFDNEKQKLIIEDTKGFRTETYKLKKKMFEYKYPELEIIEL